MKTKLIIEERIKQRGITITDFITKAGINNKTYYDVVKHNSNVTIETLEKMAEALDMSIIDLIEEE